MYRYLVFITIFVAYLYVLSCELILNINIAKPHGIFWGNNSPGTGNLLFQSHLVLDKDGKGRETNPSVREFFEDQQLGSYDAEKISKVAVEGMLHLVA